MSLVCNTKKKYPVIVGGISESPNDKPNTKPNTKPNDKPNNHLSVEYTGSECGLDVPGSVCSTKKTVNDMKIFLKKMDKPIPKNDVNVVNSLKQELGCPTEKDVIKNPTFKKNSSELNIKESLDNFKIDGPANSTRLLNNIQIDTVMLLLTKQHLKNHHMTFQMLCFNGIRDGKGWKIIKGVEATPTALSTINLVTDVINKGKDTFSVVLNTDTREGAGIHWFCLFCDFRQRPFTVEYFNSSGNMPLLPVHEWLEKTTADLQDAGYHDTKMVILAHFTHQIDSETECGPYSIYYIWSRLNNVSPDTFQTNRVKDSEMIKFRKLLFN
jgi:hypothetical protein